MLSQQMFKAASKIIAENSYMVLATSDTNGQPWITPVYFAFDDTRNIFYWYSRIDAKHSRLIAVNEKVAVTIFNTASVGAVYMSGCAHEVTAKQLHTALSVYSRREKAGDHAAQQKFLAQAQDFVGNAPLRMYGFTPATLYLLNDSIQWHGKWLDTRSKNILCE